MLNLEINIWKLYHLANIHDYHLSDEIHTIASLKSDGRLDSGMVG